MVVTCTICTVQKWNVLFACIRIRNNAVFEDESFYIQSTDHFKGLLKYEYYYLISLYLITQNMY